MGRVEGAGWVEGAGEKSEAGYTAQLDRLE